jgi:hypothetical protein
MLTRHPIRTESESSSRRMVEAHSGVLGPPKPFLLFADPLVSTSGFPVLAGVYVGKSKSLKSHDVPRGH